MTDEQWTTIAFFKPSEFDSPDQPGSGHAAMQYEFVSRLDSLRAEWGHPLVVNSGFRTPEHNATLADAKPNSAHTRGFAADLGVAGGLPGCIRFAILAARRGFNRCGVDLHGHYVHLDCDPSLPQQVVWFYNETAAVA